MYFWRWAIWKAFEKNDSGPAAVSFITAASWLSGPGFLGLRALARQHADEIWVIHLGGEGRGALQDENVFAIQTPVAIVTLIRRGLPDTGSAAKVYYQQLSGTRDSKLDALSRVTPPAHEDPNWETLEAESEYSPLVPTKHEGAWSSYAALTDLFPWQQPGAKYNRAWPISPDPAVLTQRWNALLDIRENAARAEAFVTGDTGRNIYTNVAGLPPIAELRAGQPHRPIVPYAHRSFDRQWTIEDPRLANLERPSLWNSRSDRQLYLSTMTTTPLGPGPALTVATAVPDLHHFRGSYGGKDVIPLYRDSYALEPNVTGGLLQHLAEAYARESPPAPEDLTAYIYALLAHPGYHDRFSAELTMPGPRVPVTADGSLFDEVADVGRRLLWLQTFATRYVDEASGRPRTLPRGPQIAWVRPVRDIPEDPKDIRFDEGTQTLHVGSGQVSGISQEVWSFSVSGLPVLQRWLAVRTKLGTGRSTTRSTPLDRIRPQAWLDSWNDELLELAYVLTETVAMSSTQTQLLARVVDGVVLDGAQLPQPTDASRKPPR